MKCFLTVLPANVVSGNPAWPIQSNIYGSFRINVVRSY